MTIYVAGPMTGYKDFNFPAFHDAAATLRSLGHTVLNPAENDGGDTSKPWDYYMRKDLRMLAEADAICVLEGWEKSRGATLEVHVARKLRMPVYELECDEAEHFTWYMKAVKEPQESALQEAQRLVHGDRGEAYGHPLDDFSKTAAIWTVIIGAPVTAEQVALCMVGVKISRELNRPKRDNRVDGAGYFETLQMIYDERERRKAA